MIAWLKRVFDRRTASLVFPILVEQSLVMLMGIVNSVMASHIGTTAVSAIGLVDGVNNLIIAFFSAMAVGSTVVIAHYTARQEPGNANETVKQALYASLSLVLIVMGIILVFRNQVIGLLFAGAEKEVLENTGIYLMYSAISYPFIAITSVLNGALRGASDSRTPMKVTFIMNIANVALGYVCIYGISFDDFSFGAWGITGAAIAITAARGIGAAICLYVLLRGGRSIRLERPFSFRLNKGIQKSIFGIGLPASMENVLFHIGRIYTQTFIVAAGTVDLAANYLTGPVSNIINLPGNAMNLASATLVGQAMGSGDRETARKTMWDTLFFSMLAMGAVCAVLFVLAKPLLSLYQPEEEVMALGLFYIRLSCIVSPLFWPGSFQLPGGLRSAGDAKYCMIVSVATLWIVRVGLGYLFSIVLGMGARGVWLAMFADWVARSLLYIIRLRGGRWGRKQIIFDK